MKQARAAVLSAVVLAVALAVVVVLVVIVARRGRDDFGGGSVDEVTTAMTRNGLTVCSTTPLESGGGDGGSVSRQSLTVAQPAGCDDPVTVQLDAYDDAAHRDAAARNAEGAIRPRTFGTVFTWRQYTVYLQGDDATGDADTRDRIVRALDSIGAR